MAKYRTALGKVVDMTSLAAKNEKIRAVGNMSVNARGDTIDATGRIVKPVTTKVNEGYAKTVGNRSAHVQNQQPTQARTQQRQSGAPRTSSVPPHPIVGGVNTRIDDAELSSVERELEESLEDDIEVEQIKAKETGKK